ncbi:uncharacterized protein METZ01_LOCUS257852, partial [marine metagenome]
MLLMVNLNAQTTYYVDAERPDDDGDGSSWATAKQYLQSALALAVDGDEIWVAAGTYYPDEGEGAAGNDRESNFAIPSGVKVYGGFAGEEESLEDRDWEGNETILSGDIDGTADDNSGNAYHVVIMEDVSEETVLDGFTITAGNANGAPNVAVIYGRDSQRGGGIFNRNGSPRITNCTISGNSTEGERSRGGGMYNHNEGSGAVTLTNCTISGNSTEGNYSEGGGMYNYNESSGVDKLINCTISGNSTIGNQSKGGGMYNHCQYGSPCYGVGGNANFELINCLITGNSSQSGSVPDRSGPGGGIYNFNGSPRLI